jgi:3',5'-cyclic AMP phosphodiesterase CpdA
MKRTVLLIFSMLLCAACARAADLSHPNRAEAGKLDPASCADGFSFAVMGDNQGSRKVFDFLTGLVREMKPDFAVSVGDITSNGFPSEYEMYLSQIAGAGVPWFAVPGNHEYRSAEGHTSLEGRKRFESIFGNSDFLFDHCGWRFIGLDVVAFDMLKNEQIAKLEKALKGFEGRAVVFMHYPPAVLPNWEEGYWKANADKFLALLEQYRVRYFFAGHIHIHDRLRIGPTDFIITGGAGGGLDRDIPAEQYNSPRGGAFYHFMLVKVDGDKATDILIRPDIPPDKMEDWER